MVSVAWRARGVRVWGRKERYIAGTARSSLTTATTRILGQRVRKRNGQEGRRRRRTGEPALARWRISRGGQKALVEVAFCGNVFARCALPRRTCALGGGFEDVATETTTRYQQLRGSRTASGPVVLVCVSAIMAAGIAHAVAGQLVPREQSSAVSGRYADAPLR